MQNYVTIKEASKLTSKHTDTIRRLVKVNKGNQQIIVTNSKGQYLIKKDWLLQQYGIEVENEALREPVSDSNNKYDKSGDWDDMTSTSALYEALAEQLKAKDKQIEQLQQIIIDKEANTTKLQDQFQQLLASQQLPARVTEVPQENHKAEATIVEKPKPAQKTTAPKKGVAKKSVKTKKPAQKTAKRWWSR